MSAAHCSPVVRREIRDLPLSTPPRRTADGQRPACKEAAHNPSPLHYRSAEDIYVRIALSKILHRVISSLAPTDSGRALKDLSAGRTFRRSFRPVRGTSVFHRPGKRRGASVLL